MFQVGYKIATSESSGKHPIAGGCYCYTFWVRQAISDEKMFCRPVDVFPAPQTHTSFVTTSITLSHKNSNLGKPCELSLFPTHSGSLRCFSVSYTVTSIFWSGCNNFVYLMTGRINSYHRVQNINPSLLPLHQTLHKWFLTLVLNQILIVWCFFVCFSLIECDCVCFMCMCFYS